MLARLLLLLGLLLPGSFAYGQAVFPTPNGTTAAGGAIIMCPKTGSNPVTYVPCDTTNPLPPTTATAPVGLTTTDRTITSATGASQTVMAANAARHSLQIVNTGNANCGINPTGGTAAIGGAGTITLAPLGSYSPRIPTVSAVTAICTAAQPLYADEN